MTDPHTGTSQPTEPLRARSEGVFAFIEALIRSLPVPEGYRELLLLHLDVGRKQAQVYPGLPAIELPLLVHAAIAGDEGPAHPVAGACTLLYLGADLFDNIIDQELPPGWESREAGEANLAATTLLAALPQLSIARLRERGTPAGRLWALSHLFAETLLTMGAGEHEDLLLTERDDTNLEMCRAVAERKSGSEFALFARAGATLATDDLAVIEEYTAFGLCLGTASQICSDVMDIWDEETGRDLLNGKPTLPIVHALHTLRGASRERLQELLEAASESPGCHGEVRALLAAAGAVDYTALVAGVYLQRARERLDAASPLEPARGDLLALLDAVSLP